MLRIMRRRLINAHVGNLKIACGEVCKRIMSKRPRTHLKERVAPTALPPVFGVRTFDTNRFAHTNGLFVNQGILVSLSQPPVLQISPLLTENNFRTLGCIRATLEFFVFLFLSLHFEVLELPRGINDCVSTAELSVDCSVAFLIFASRSTCLVSSRWRAAFRALLGGGMRAGEADASELVANARSSNVKNA